MANDRPKYQNINPCGDAYVAARDIHIHQAPSPPELRIPGATLNTVDLFMNESGNGNTERPLVVGAIELGDDADDVEANIRALYKQLSAMRRLAGLPSFEEFRKSGFDSDNNPREISDSLLELMRNTYFRAYIVATNRTKVPGNTDTDQIEFMYVKLLSDLLIRHRSKSDLHIHIEQRTEIRSIIQQLPRSATKRAYITLGKAAPLPQLNIEVVTKTDCMSMAIVDYVTTTVARWLQENSTTNPEDRAYQEFREIEPSISVLYSFEHGRISSRKDPLK